MRQIKLNSNGKKAINIFKQNYFFLVLSKEAVKSGNPTALCRLRPLTIPNFFFTTFL